MSESMNCICSSWWVNPACLVHDGHQDFGDTQ